MTKAANLSALGSNVTTAGNISSESTLTLQTNSTTALTIDTSQNVGIGTTSPATKLDITNGYTTDNNTSFTLTNSQGSSGDNGAITYRTFTGSGYMTSAQINSGPGSAFNASYLKFRVADSSQALQERMRIDSNGNVGIGTTTPNFRGSAGGKFLAVAGASAPGGVLELVNTNADADNNYSTIAFIADANTLAVNKSIAQVEAFTSGTTAANRGGTLIFTTKADGGSNTERMRIDSSGNITITGTILSSSVAVGDLGTYAWLAYAAVSTATIVAGTNYAGSGLRYFGYTGTSTGAASGGTLPATTPSGTWKAMGNVNTATSLIKHTLYLRVA